MKTEREIELKKAYIEGFIEGAEGYPSWRSDEIKERKKQIDILNWVLGIDVVKKEAALEE